MLTSNAKHQAAHRARLRQARKQPVSVVLDDNTANTLRRLTKEHDKTQGEIIALGLLLAHQRLAKQAAPVATKQELQPVEPTAPAGLRAPEGRAIALASVATREVPAHA